MAEGPPARNETARSIQRTYLVLTLLTTFASSFIWGINTIFLLDAGLSNVEAFAANAFFTVGQVLFEIPTGVIADTRGRQTSYVLGAGTLLVSTLLYLVMWQIQAPLLGWALASILLGLGFTFFSGATEAWLVDALDATGFTGGLEQVFGRAQTVGGAAMLVGTVAGGVIAQLTSLGVPYLIRAAILGLTMLVALRYMRDLGFTPQRDVSALAGIRTVLRGSIDGGFRNPPVRWIMLAAPFTAGAGIFVFYAAQPYLLELYGDQTAYGVAGLAAAIVAGAQIVGGLAVSRVRRLFRRRTTALGLGRRAQCRPRGAAGAGRRVRRGAVAPRDLGVRVRGLRADAPGVSQRADPVVAAGDRPVVRLDDGLGRRRHRAAGARPRRRHRWLWRGLPRLGRHPGPGHPVRAAGPSGACELRPDRARRQADAGWLTSWSTGRVTCAGPLPSISTIATNAAATTTSGQTGGSGAAITRPTSIAPRITSR